MNTYNMYFVGKIKEIHVLVFMVRLFRVICRIMWEAAALLGFVISSYKLSLKKLSIQSHYTSLAI